LVLIHEVVSSSRNDFSLAIPENYSRQQLIEEYQRRMDEAERFNQDPFSDFDDLDMMMWYLYRPTNLNPNKEKSAKTVRAYKRILEQFINHLLQYGHEIVLDLKFPESRDNISLFKLLEKRHLRRYQEWLAKRSPHVVKNGPYSPATLENKITVIKTFFKTLYQWGYIEKPIHEGFLSVGVSKDERPNRDAGPQDVLKLLEAFDKMGHIPMFTFIQVLTSTGMRNEELCRLKVKDLKQDTILGGFYLQVRGKGNKARQIPLRPKTLETIKRFRAARGLKPLHEADPNEPLFTTNRMKAYSPSYFSQYFNSQIKLLPKAILEDFQHIEITPHLFRHAFAIISRLEGIDVYTIMRSLGHERIETTEIYLEKVFEKERHAIHQWSDGVLGRYI